MGAEASKIPIFCQKIKNYGKAVKLFKQLLLKRHNNNNSKIGEKIYITCRKGIDQIFLLLICHFAFNKDFRIFYCVSSLELKKVC